MNPWPIVRADLRRNRLLAAATILLVALALATGIAVISQERALRQGSALILNEGLDACFARHEAVAAACRQGLADMGLKLFRVPGAVAAPTVTAAYVPDGVDWNVWRNALKSAGLAVARSFGPMRDKVFRLGHMGTQANMTLLRRALDIIAAHLPC